MPHHIQSGVRLFLTAMQIEKVLRQQLGFHEPNVDTGVTYIEGGNEGLEPAEIAARDKSACSVKSWGLMLLEQAAGAAAARSRHRFRQDAHRLRPEPESHGHHCRT
jgi:hypothetical protein